MADTELKLCLLPASMARANATTCMPAPQAHALAVFQRLLDELPGDELHDYSEAIERALAPRATPEQRARAAALAGDEIGSSERLELAMRALRAGFERRRELLDGALTTDQVRRLLGTSRQTPHDRVKARSLLAVRVDGALRFPRWQLDPEGPDGVLDGFVDTLRALHLEGLAAVSWFVRPSPVLEGRTPVEALKAGDRQRVVDLAGSVGQI